MEQALAAMEESIHGLSAQHEQSLVETRSRLLAAECSNAELEAALSSMREQHRQSEDQHREAAQAMALRLQGLEETKASLLQSLELLEAGREELASELESTRARAADQLAAAEAELKAFLFKNMYRAAGVMRVREEADHVVRRLFSAYMADPRAMPEGWREGLDRAEDRIKARHVTDFLAGMTDYYALKEHRRLFDRTPDLG